MRAQQIHADLARQRQRAIQRYSVSYDGPQPTAGETLQAVGDLVVVTVQLALWLVAFRFRLVWAISVLSYRGGKKLIRMFW